MASVKKKEKQAFTKSGCDSPYHEIQYSIGHQVNYNY